MSCQVVQKGTMDCQDLIMVSRALCVIILVQLQHQLGSRSFSGEITVSFWLLKIQISES